MSDDCRNPTACSRNDYGYCTCKPLKPIEATKALVEYTPPSFMTEREARIAGTTSNRLCGLRGMLKQGIRSATLNVQTSNGSQTENLTTVDAEALVAFLIERGEQLLVGFNIELER